MARPSRDLSAALAVAKTQIPIPRNVPTTTGDWRGMCLMFVRLCWGIAPVGLPDADTAWEDCVARNHDVRGGSYPPAGAPVYWKIGKHGHAALSAGRGMVYSTDILKTGHVAYVSLGTIAARWGAQYRGWSRGYGGYTLPLALAHYGSVRDAARRDPGRRQGGQTTGAAASVRLVENALAAEGYLPPRWKSDGSFGSMTLTAYVKWQRHLGYRGNDADGIPGLKSLTALGNAHGFGVY